jgi:hypothetical protein
MCQEKLPVHTWLSTNPYYWLFPAKVRWYYWVANQIGGQGAPQSRDKLDLHHFGPV